MSPTPECCAGTVASTSWLTGVSGDDDPRTAGDGTILPYDGHGTFVAGVIRSQAPEADIIVRNVFNIAGSQLESVFVPDLYAGFGYGADIFHLTVAAPTRCNFPLLAFEAWLEDLRQHKGVVCVVAAGNNGDKVPPCWPAAFPEVISVGALGTDWRSRAYFSNFGGWVDVYAPGQNLVNAFATGPYICQVAPFAGEVRHFSGMAQWSGTSFSSPIVTGLIAARMARCGESAQEAAAALLAKARAQAIPGLGPVLLPCCDDDDHQRHGGRCDHGCRGGDHGCGDHDCHGGGHGCGHGCGMGVVTATTDRFSSVISRVCVLDRDAGPSVLVSESAGFRGDPRTRDWLAGYRDAVGAPVRCGLVSVIRCARAIRMSRWIVNVTPKYSSRDAEPRPASAPLPSTR